jgi:hypothetical protein
VDRSKTPENQFAFGVLCFFTPKPSIKQARDFFRFAQKNPEVNRSKTPKNQFAFGVLCFFMPCPLTEASFVRVKA